MDRQLTNIIVNECQQLLNRVTQLTDSSQWQQLAECYTEDAQLFRPSDPNNGIHGRAAILASFRDRPPRISCHMLANTLFDIHDEHTVTANSRVWLCTGDLTDVSPAPTDGKILIGTFIDKLVYKNDQWLIELRKGSIELKHG